MELWERVVAAVVAVLFVAYLSWRYRPAVLAARPGVLAAVLHARDRARGAKDTAGRATALLEAAELSARAGHVTSAIGYCLRAARVAPTSVEPVLALRRLLERRAPEDLERLLWRRLGSSPLGGDTDPVARVALEGLVALYAGRLKDRDRAAALGQLLTRV